MDNTSISSKLFRKLIWTNIYMLILEILSWKFDQKIGVNNYYLNYISNMLFAWSTPLITCLWVSYIDYNIFYSVKRLRKRYFYLLPMLINTILIMINIFKPIIFSIDKNNIYSREPLMWLLVGINTFLLVYVWNMARKNRKKIDNNVISAILLFVLLPSIAAIIQVLVFGAFILWPTMAITIVITYIFMETYSTSKDYLTGLFCRQKIDIYIDHMIASKKEFNLIMIDLDNFKTINDNYGHVKGDETLKLFSKSLKKIFMQSNLIGRYAGDEFIIVDNSLNKDDIEILMTKLEQLLRNEKNQNKLPFKIGFSYGVKNWEQGFSYEILLNLTDQEMYKNKRSK